MLFGKKRCDFPSSALPVQVVMTSAAKRRRNSESWKRGSACIRGPPRNIDRRGALAVASFPEDEGELFRLSE